VEDFMTALANVGAREPDVQQEDARRSSDNAIGAAERDVPRDVTFESLAARANTDDILAAILNSRDLGPGADIEARNWLLAARNGAEDFVDSIINRRDTNPNEFANLLSALASRHDDTADELAARGGWEDLLNGLNTREWVSNGTCRPAVS
jgi:hypothetical protein